MLGNFTYCNPTKLYFGKGALASLEGELNRYGKTVMLVYGGGSIKKNGIYDDVLALLRKCGKTVVEDAGVMPNPTVEKLYEGCAIARDNAVDLILAVGGGSVCDYSKAVSVSAYCKEDPWDKYFIRFEEPDADTRHVFGEEVYPKFSVLDPEYTFSVPEYQMKAGIFDIMSHILEQYLSGTDDNTSDYISEGLMRSLIVSANAAVKNPTDYEARSNIMWTATWALNTLIAKGKTTDWEVHMLGQAVGAHTNATHGMTLSAVTMPYFHFILPYATARFARFAVNVWGVSPEGKSDTEVALMGLDAMEKWMKKIGFVMNISELGVTEDMIEAVADSTLIMQGGYKVLTRSEVVEILTAAL